MIQINFKEFEPQYSTALMLGNVNDNLSNTVDFVFDKVIQGVDLTTLTCTIIFLNAEDAGATELLSATEIGDKVVYSWVVKNISTTIKGKLQWQLVFVGEDGWAKYTKICKFKIGDSIHIEEVIDNIP